MLDLSPEIEALARRLADAQKISVEAAVKQALEACASSVGIVPETRHSRERSPATAAARRERIERMVRDIAAMPVLDQRTPREIMDDLNDL